VTYILNVKVECNFLIAIRGERIRLVNLGSLRQLSISLQIPRLIRSILQNDICLCILKLTQTEQNDIALIDPYFLAKFASDMSETFLSIETLGFQTSVSQHFRDLGVFYS